MFRYRLLYSAMQVYFTIKIKPLFTITIALPNCEYCSIDVYYTAKPSIIIPVYMCNNWFDRRPLENNQCFQIQGIQITSRRNLLMAAGCVFSCLLPLPHPQKDLIVQNRTWGDNKGRAWKGRRPTLNP